MSRPHIAEVGRVGDTEQFRNVLRHQVNLKDDILAFRVDQSVNFANASVLENFVLSRISDRPKVKHVLMIASGINDIDATGIEMLETLNQELADADIEFHWSDVKGPVLDRLRKSGFSNDFLDKRVYLFGTHCISAFEPGAESAGQRFTRTRFTTTARRTSE